MIPQHPQMTSAFPYFLAVRVHFLNAMWSWISDNNMTPQILVDATVAGVDVPIHHVKEGKIVLNISASATGQLAIREDHVSFIARFNGKAQSIFVPINAVMAIYARETGVGMGFPPAEQPVGVNEAAPLEVPAPEQDPTPPTDGDVPPPPRARGHLRIVK